VFNASAYSRRWVSWSKIQEIKMTVNTAYELELAASVPGFLGQALFLVVAQRLANVARGCFSPSVLATRIQGSSTYLTGR